MDISFTGFLKFLLLALFALFFTIAVAFVGMFVMYGIFWGANTILMCSIYPTFFITLYGIAVFLLTVFFFYCLVMTLVYI